MEGWCRGLSLQRSNVASVVADEDKFAAVLPDTVQDRIGLHETKLKIRIS